MDSVCREEAGGKFIHRHKERVLKSCFSSESRVSLAPGFWGGPSTRMSQFLIQQYLNDLSDLRKASGTTREGVVSEAFKGFAEGICQIPRSDLSEPI